MTKKTQREDVPLPQAPPTCQQMFHDKENTEGGCTAATSPAPPLSRCSMSKKTQREDVPLPQAQPQLSVDVPYQRKHRGRMYRCHKPSPTCQQMFHVKENTEGGFTAATSLAPPVSRCSMSKKTQRECVPAATSPAPTVSRCSMSKKTQREDVQLSQAQPHLSADVPCQRKHRGRMYRCTSQAPPVSRCSMTKKTEREDVPLPHQPHPPSVFSLTWNIY